MKKIWPFETLILQLLYENKNDTVKRKDILKKIWNDENDLYSRCLDRFITELRNKLKVDKSVQIVNTRGIGYKLTC
jgi:DNA-binding response OmpR family regulator